MCTSFHGPTFPKSTWTKSSITKYGSNGIKWGRVNQFSKMAFISYPPKSGIFNVSPHNLRSNIWILFNLLEYFQAKPWWNAIFHCHWMLSTWNRTIPDLCCLILQGTKLCPNYDQRTSVDFQWCLGELGS